eukprot:11397-Heterococcus_DN1.PRE.1
MRSSSIAAACRFMTRHAACHTSDETAHTVQHEGDWGSTAVKLAANRQAFCTGVLCSHQRSSSATSPLHLAPVQYEEVEGDSCSVKLLHWRMAQHVSAGAVISQVLPSLSTGQSAAITLSCHGLSYTAVRAKAHRCR